MEYYTIKDIGERTGLTFAYIDKCIKRMDLIFKPHTTRGENNSRLFDSSALVIFDNISQLKQDGLTVAEIATRIEQGINSGGNQTSKPIVTDIKTIETSVNQTDEILKIIAVYQQRIDEQRLKVESEMSKRIELQSEFHEKISNLEREKEAMAGALKLLPSGKSPEQLREEWEEAQRRKIEINQLVARLQSLSITQFLQRRKILKRLEELTN